ncbi:hypothetical protein [Streptomyces sp. DH12]|uniref:hypothetical protein n=1 Tax=Streptomyces sp. DH12 TaxID=2857010 RepID=UPI001E3FFB6B|nr:hypothetical protein [Streptomyces sp. DH12]
MAIIPTTLTATELANHLAEQVIPLRAMFRSTNAQTGIGAVYVHDGVFALVRALRAGEMAPAVARVRLLGINRQGACYGIRHITAHPAP